MAENAQQGHKVFVGNLSYETDEEELTKLFKASCNVIDAQIVKRQDRSKGFGFVTVKNEDDVTKAVEALHHTELQGRQINVESAKALTERPPRQPKVKTEDKQPSEPREPGDKPRRKRKPKKKPSAQQADGEAVEGEATPARGPRGLRNRTARPRGEPSKTTVFVGNLAFKTTEEQLTQHFAGYNLVRVHIVRNKTGKAQGVGFVEIDTEANRDAAIEQLNKSKLDDRPLLLKVATIERPKEEQETKEEL